MRISDWSSDVCSSDLGPLLAGHVEGRLLVRVLAVAERLLALGRQQQGGREILAVLAREPGGDHRIIGAGMGIGLGGKRSEERRVGKECAGRVDLGGGRCIKKKKKADTARNTST